MRNDLKRRIQLVEDQQISGNDTKTYLLVVRPTPDVFQLDNTRLCRILNEEDERFYRRACLAFNADELISLIPYKVPTDAY